MCVYIYIYIYTLIHSPTSPAGGGSACSTPRSEARSAALALRDWDFIYGNFYRLYLQELYFHKYIIYMFFTCMNSCV